MSGVWSSCRRCTSLRRLIADRQRLLIDPAAARRPGQGGWRMACERFGSQRFVAGWRATLRMMVA